ncbi:cystatin-M [Monodelphis domestica]|uniref:Cystatin E/M n=1 Tax=Monodelphis domestica TaxID=13616 RepID=K7E4J7_MONDO|nr:cystatin-M [Monodelphis domestica]
MLLPLLVLSVAALTLPGAHGDLGGDAPHPGNMLGARTTLSTSSSEVKEVAQKAVEIFNQASNSEYFFKGSKVIKAEKQLVTGIKYFLTVEMGSTECRKDMVTGSKLSLAGCPFSAEEEKVQCEFEMLVVPWRNETTLQKTSCTPI